MADVKESMVTSYGAVLAILEANIGRPLPRYVTGELVCQVAEAIEADPTATEAERLAIANGKIRAAYEASR